jgi:hypothetical protein
VHNNASATGKKPAFTAAFFQKSSIFHALGRRFVGILVCSAQRMALTEPL